MPGDFLASLKKLETAALSFCGPCNNNSMHCVPLTGVSREAETDTATELQ